MKFLIRTLSGKKPNVDGLIKVGPEYIDESGKKWKNIGQHTWAIRVGSLKQLMEMCERFDGDVILSAGSAPMIIIRDEDER